MDEILQRPERRSDDPRVTRILENVETLTEDIKTLKATIDAVDTQTREMREFWTALEGGIKVLRVLGAVAKWGGGVVAAVAAAWFAVKHGGQPR